MAKRLELLREVIPQLRRVALLANPGNPALPAIRNALESAARSAGLELHEFSARRAVDLSTVFDAMVKANIDAVLVQEDPVFTVNTAAIASRALDSRLPLGGHGSYADSGGLFSFGVNYPALYRRAAYFVDRILKGTKPGELPVEQPTRFELILNQKTAHVLGIKLPQAVLMRADSVIE